MQTAYHDSAIILKAFLSNGINQWLNFKKLSNRKKFMKKEYRINFLVLFSTYLIEKPIKKLLQKILFDSALTKSLLTNASCKIRWWINGGIKSSSLFEIIYFIE